MGAVPAGVPLFNTSGTVYTPDPTTKRYTVAGATFPCRLAHNPTGAGAAQAQRAELMGSRRLLWPPDVFLPDFCEVEVEGTRWRPLAGTYGTFVKEWPSYKAALVVKRVA